MFPILPMIYTREETEVVFKRKVQIFAAIICFVLSFAITLQYKSVTKNTNAGIKETKRLTELEQQVINANSEIISLKKENMKLRGDIDIYRQDAASKDGGAAALKKELEKSHVVMGLTDVEGKGVEITLADSTQTTNTSESTDIVHDRDLRDVVNELYGAGAEAVSINSERIVSNTAIRCVGNTIMINDKRFSSPFVIKAIGDSDALESSLNLRGGVLDVLRLYNIQVNVTKSDKIKISKFTGHVDVTYAKSEK